MFDYRRVCTCCEHRYFAVVLLSILYMPTPQLASGLHLLLRDVSWICNTLGIGLDSVPPFSLVSICIQVVYVPLLLLALLAVTIQTLNL